jgi:hypothetical protein
MEHSTLAEAPGARKPWSGLLTTAALALIPALLYVLLTTPRITAQGLYYDELHQVPASFAYLGHHVEQFAYAPIHGIPLLNMPYSGALKSAVYGLYMRFFKQPFTVRSWRLVGILFVVAGLVVFGGTAARASPTAAALTAALLITDPSILLTTRHDWGPVALALALRLGFVGLWLSGERKATVSPWNSLLLGALAGLSIFEKLSSVVLIVPLTFIVVQRTMYRGKHLAAAAAGLVIGALPLIVVNCMSLARDGSLISLSAPPEIGRSWNAATHAFGFISLSDGNLARRFVLGSSTPPPIRVLEAIFLLTALVLAGRIAVRSSRPQARLVVTALASYLLIGLALFFMPQSTWIYHWVIATPFQYAAIGLALTRGDVPMARSQRLLGAVFSILILIRLANLASLETALWRGESASRFHPDLTKAGEFAFRHRNDAVFIAANWGIATELYALSNGQPGLVYELWGNYRGSDVISDIHSQSNRSVLYVVEYLDLDIYTEGGAVRILRDIRADRRWVERPTEPDAIFAGPIRVTKFYYLPHRWTRVEGTLLPGSTTESCNVERANGHDLGTDAISISGPILKLTGWTLMSASGPVPDTTVVILESDNGDVYSVAARGTHRPDVAAYFKRDELLNSGFEVTGDRRELKAGRYRVLVRMRSATGRVVTCNPHRELELL